VGFRFIRVMQLL